jgi:endogenous inhibitor of DNA gyrase (YacG/DUF329 family)
VIEAMRCPICHKKVSIPGNPYRPFCSERCKWIDLNNWLSERYRISTPLEAQEKASEALTTDRPTKEMLD